VGSRNAGWLRSGPVVHLVMRAPSPEAACGTTSERYGLRLTTRTALITCKRCRRLKGESRRG
jgi:hypothetical protein